MRLPLRSGPRESVRVGCRQLGGIPVVSGCGWITKNHGFWELQDDAFTDDHHGYRSSPCIVKAHPARTGWAFRIKNMIVSRCRRHRIASLPHNPSLPPAVMDGELPLV